MLDAHWGSLCIFSASSNVPRPGNGISRQEAAEIFKVSKERPVARVKPIVKVESPANLLGEILGKQKEFLKPLDPSSNFVPTRKRTIEEEPLEAKVKLTVKIDLVRNLLRV